MQLATSTNLLSFNRDGSKTEMIHLIPKLKEIGYQNLDLNFCEMMNPTSSLLGDDSQLYLEKLKAYKAEIGINYVQSHVPYAQDYLALPEQGQKHMDTLITKAIEYSAFLDIDTIVIHPIKGSLDDNLKYFEKVLKETPSKCKLAIENMDRKDELFDITKLISLVKALQCKSVGICLDTGHAALNYQEFKPIINELGDHLIATHIADNHLKEDEHLLPFFGSIKWEEVMQALNEINYSHYLTYEVMFFMAKLPESLKLKAAQLSLDIGAYLLSIAN